MREKWKRIPESLLLETFELSFPSSGIYRELWKVYSKTSSSTEPWYVILLQFILAIKVVHPLLTQDIVWALNVVDVRKTLKQRCVIFSRNNPCCLEVVSIFFEHYGRHMDVETTLSN